VHERYGQTTDGRAETKKIVTNVDCCNLVHDELKLLEFYLLKFGTRYACHARAVGLYGGEHECPK